MTERVNDAPLPPGGGASSSSPMGSVPALVSAPAVAESHRSWLNLLGVVVVGAWLFYLRDEPLSAFLSIAAIIGLAGWLAWALLPYGRLRDVAIVVSAVAGATAIVGTDAILIAIVIVALVAFASSPTRPPWAALLLTVVCGIVLGVFATIARSPVEFLLGTYGGLALGVAVGFARRQNQLVEHRERQLLARSLEAERERDRAHLLADRAIVARDIHDVLAHSLGGLVIQLDAVEALLEAGRTAEAATRVTAARRLAGDGLVEARRAVAALRETAPPAPAAVPDDALSELLVTHRALGGSATVEGPLTLAPLADHRREVALRVLQEALSNARRHAPDVTVRIRVRDSDSDSDSDAATGGWALRIATTLPLAPVRGPGGGQGLIGMRERVAALGDGSTVTAGRVGDDFVVELELAGEDRA